MVVFPYFSTLYKSQSSMNFSKDGIWIEYIEIIYSGLSERQTEVIFFYSGMAMIKVRPNLFC